MEPKISVIVPVFNTEPVLRRCVDSVLAQSFSDWELILVDDGSTDRSGNICDEYSKEDSRIKVIHKSNGGAGSARNSGMDASTGGVITFVDSDDYLQPGMLSTIASEADADLVICGFSNGGMTFAPLGYSQEEISTHISELVENPYYLDSPWSKLFKRAIIEDYQLRFDQTVRLGEDTLFSYQYVAHCHTVSVISTALYHYDGVWGGGSKYLLSREELLHTADRSVEAIRKINRTFGCNISSRYKCFHISRLEDLYSAYKDVDAYEMYVETHDYIPIDEFLGDCRISPLVSAISQAWDLVRNGNRTQAVALMENLSHFMTVPLSKIRFGSGKYKAFCYFWKMMGSKVAVAALKLISN